MRKIIFFVVISLMPLLIGGAYVAAKKMPDIPEINQAFLQSEADRLVPMTESVLGVTYTVREVKFALDNNINTRFVVEVKGHGYSGRVDADVTGVPYWHKQNAALHLQPDPDHPEPIRFSKLKFKKSIWQQGKDLVGVGQSKGERFMRSMADKALLNDENLKRGATRVISAYLESLPIAKLPDDGIGWKVVAVAVDRVDIVGDVVKITVSLLALTEYVLAQLIALMLAVITAIGLLMSGPRMFGAAVVGSAVINS